MRKEFRNAILERFENCCAVTGCRIIDILEAAHISPYRGGDDNDPTNGLLLRADIHTLFDLDLLGIEPDQLQIELHPEICNDYGDLAGKKLQCPKNRRPSREALEVRYKQFLERMQLNME